MRRRGVTLIETTIALSLLLLGLLGLAQMQIVAVKANRFGRQLGLGTALARDLVENVALWKWNDPRLAPVATVASLSDPGIGRRMSAGREDLLASDARQEFGERAGDPNALNAGALGAYGGATSDLDNDGIPDFSRYWSVFALDPDGDGVASAKFVVVVVRWKEASGVPGASMRQVVTTTVKTNAEVFRQ